MIKGSMLGALLGLSVGFFAYLFALRCKIKMEEERYNKRK